MSTNKGLLSIGEVARRTGLAVSAIRYYDDEGWSPRGARRAASACSSAPTSGAVLHPDCPANGIFARGDPHPAQAIAAGAHAQQARLGKDQPRFRAHLDARIAMLERLRDRLDGCIGCGCLSLETCKLYNPDDRHARTGTGPRLVVQTSHAIEQ
jgi:MerR family redox-sensitive transcriptional activator SoxR